MGVNNRQRRAAKKKKARSRGSGFDMRDPLAPRLTPGDVRGLLLDVIEQIWDDSQAAARCSELLLAPGRVLTPEIARSGVRALAAELTQRVVANGWSPDDLAEVVVRRASDKHVPLVLALLHEEVGRHAPARVPAVWTDDLIACGAAGEVHLHTAEGMQLVLEVLAVLAQLPSVAPVMPAPGDALAAAGAVRPEQAKLLRRVQALLAKAEATEYAEEAEALSAKAQELVSRHALDRLLAQADAGRPDEQPVVRRLWLDAPYVFPKAMLVHEVAGANRCRSVVAEQLGFCNLVGRPDDLAVVEVLVPSLLVQAHAAMVRFGRQTDRVGTSRTRSFRQSFLLSYARRIGERLQAADAAATEGNARSAELVPVLRRHEEQLQAACDELFPHLTSKSGAVNNAAGWAAGRAAADQALLGAEQQLSAAG